jgi:hypothetical protein
MNTVLNTLEWIPVEEAMKPYGLAALAALGGEARLMSERIRLTGLPKLTGTPREKAITLLRTAAEVEHAFVVQYLFAANSLDSNDANGGAWFVKIKAIAEEEMGHLATVQNLLALLGQPPHLARQTYPAPPSYPFEKIFEPFSLDWLGDFVVAESPLGATFPPGLKPGCDPQRVGVIYSQIYWLFKASEAPGPPWNIPNPHLPPEHLSDADFADPASLTDRLMNLDDWNQELDTDPPGQPAIGPKLLAFGPYSDRAKERQGALDAIYDIMAQGEGPIPMMDSHFNRLSTIYTQASAVAKLPVLAIPKNPHGVAESGGDPEKEPGLITNPLAISVAKLLNLRYAMLLTEIQQIVVTPRSVMSGTTPLRQVISEWAIDNEMSAIGRLSLAAVNQPLKKTATAASDLRAAPPFEPPDALPSNDADTWKFYLYVFDTTKQVASQIGAQVPDLARIVSADDGRRSMIPPH